MADVKISELTAASAVVDANEFEINEAGTSKKVTAAQIKTYLAQPLVYVALLNQTGTAAPIATVMKNTLGGTLVWTRTGAGTYTGTLASAFTVDKTFIPNPNVILQYSGTDWQYFDLSRASANAVSLITSYGANGAGAATDALLVNYPVKIEVYP